MSARDVGAAAQVDPALVPGVETEMATWPPVRLVVTGQGWVRSGKTRTEPSNRTPLTRKRPSP